MALPETEVHILCQQVKMEFGERHAKTRDFLKRRFEQIRPCLATEENLSEERQLLLGAYFSHEYSLEAAALFNPSIVPHPEQSGLPPGALRFILSLRATGEGHISSITFRTGLLDAQSNITINAPTRYCLEPEQVPNASYENIYVMFSDHLHFWHATQLVLKPAFPWVFIQLGNCGSPLETDAGRLVLSHGVGPMRKYCIGAFLLDRDDPARMIGRLASR